jgi:hypothetical protein
VVVKYGVHGPAEDLTPPSFNARTGVHEYGGAVLLVREGTVYFANFADQKLYRRPKFNATPSASAFAGVTGSLLR